MDVRIKQTAVCFMLGGAVLHAIVMAQSPRFDVSKAEELMELTGSSGEIQDLVFSPDGKSLAIAAGDPVGRIWNLEQGRLGVQLKGHEKTIKGMAYSPDGKSVLTIGDDYFLKIWDSSGKQTSSFNLKCNSSTGDVLWTKDNRALVACKTLRYVNLKTGAFTGEFKDIFAYRMAMPTDQSSVAVSVGDKDFALLDTKTLERYRVLKGHESQGFFISYSADGKLIATGASDRTARVWNASTGKTLQVLRHDLSINDVALSPNGKILATACDDDTVKLWDTASGEQLRTLEHKEDVLQLAWSKDGQRL
ncbi:MAG: WD40 repeat domain-containing protein, partial [Pleurocapsa sp. SU_196_0]|nr:WD40 repeat domain-containing protein [Pleurocapsa sp. SU_196_0]